MKVPGVVFFVLTGCPRERGLKTWWNVQKFAHYWLVQGKIELKDYDLRLIFVATILTFTLLKICLPILK